MEKNMKKVFQAVDELDSIQQTLNKVASILSITFQTITETKAKDGFYELTSGQVNALDHIDDQIARINKEIEENVREIQGIFRESRASE